MLSLVALVLAGCASQPRQPADWPPPESSGTPGTPPPALAPNSPASAVSRTDAPGEGWISLNRWCEANGLPAPRHSGNSAPASSYALSLAAGLLVLRAGSQLAYLNGLEFWLGFPLRTVSGQLTLHALDLEKNLGPLLESPREARAETRRVIVLDPGHGGSDVGASSVLSRGYEKDFTLDWAQRLARLLEANGWRVLLTRTQDTNVPLAERLAFAEARQADLFLSLHFNSAAPQQEEAGLETYCLTPAGMPSNVTRGWADDLSVTFPNNAFDAENLRLAMRVHRALLEVNGHLDRGVRRARFPAVLRGQVRPAILVEGGYLSNPGEARRIAEPAYRQRLAEAVARALE